MWTEFRRLCQLWVVLCEWCLVVLQRRQVPAAASSADTDFAWKEFLSVSSFFIESDNITELRKQKLNIRTSRNTWHSSDQY